MNFTREQVQKLLTGSLTQLRVLRKKRNIYARTLLKKPHGSLEKKIQLQVR